MPDALSRLLPANRTRLEAALADTLGATDHDERSITKLYQPRDIPAATLPWLAWGEDVLAWQHAGDETTRRNLVAGSWRLHRIQGTLAGLSVMAGYGGGRIERAITPPAKVFASPAFTRQERNAFVAQHPQLRIYRYRQRGQRATAMLHRCHAGAAWPGVTDAALRLAPRAWIWRTGGAAEIVINERAGEVSIAVPGRAPHGGFAGGHPRRAAALDAGTRRYTLCLAEVYRDSGILRRPLVASGMAPLDTRYDLIAEPGTAAGLFIGHCLSGPLRATTAGARLYQRVHLFDASIAPAPRRAALHLAGARLSMPSHHAELRLRLSGRAHPLATWRHVGGHLVAQPRQALNACLGAMRSVARAAEKILIDTACTRPMRAGIHLTAGAVIAGDWN